MRRFVEALLSDWPLKLGALGLATALYIGLSLSQNVRTWPGQVPIEVLDPPRGAAVLDLPGSVSEIEYRAPLDAAVTLANGSFLASIDLSDVVPTADGEPVAVPVRVIALDPRVQVVGYSPESVNVRVDTLVTRPVVITVDRGTVPTDLALGPPVVSPASAVLRGASSRVAGVQAVVARVAVDDSGLNIDQDVDLEAVDETGAVVPGVEVLPERAHVSIEVARELAYATLPVVPVVTGSPAPGYRLVAVAAVPTTLTVSGESSAVTRLTSVPTQPLDITGLTDSLEASIDADLPPDVSLVGEGTVQVQVTIEPQVGSRTWQVGVRIAGARPAREYALSASTVQVTFGGPAPVLESLDGATIVAAVEVGDLSVGRHEVNVTVTPIEGLDLLEVAPAVIRVDVSRGSAGSPPPTASPGASSLPVASTVPAASVAP
ncbi:MAG: CdaR family protein [Candidatus Limnocylindrales bacterium]